MINVNLEIDRPNFELSDSEAGVVYFSLELYQSVPVQPVAIWPVLVILLRVIKITWNCTIIIVRL